MIPSQTISLDNFEGPLDLLLFLIQKNEIDIYDIRIQIITQQFLETIDQLTSARVDVGAEFLGITATLLLIKSQKLLPRTSLEKETIEDDPRFTLIEQLLEYCRFKDISKELYSWEEREQAHFPRGLYAPPQTKKDLSSLAPLSLGDLENVLREILNRQASRVSSIIQDERWHVADKISWIKQEISLHKKMTFSLLFSSEKPKEELIVTFLAVLELMKCGEITVLQDGIKSCS